MGLCSISTVSGIFTANPAYIEHMLKLNSSNYLKGGRTISMMEDFLGHGIFNSDGEEWKCEKPPAMSSIKNHYAALLWRWSILRFRG
jgi:hypothetical protein